MDSIIKAVTKYALLLEALNALEKAGLFESVAADAVRDCMDRPWVEISEEDRNFVRNMSAYLYDLGELKCDE